MTEKLIRDQDGRTVYGIDSGGPSGDKAMMAEVRRLDDGTLEVVSIGEVIDGDVLLPRAERMDDYT